MQLAKVLLALGVIGSVCIGLAWSDCVPVQVNNQQVVFIPPAAGAATRYAVITPQQALDYVLVSLKPPEDSTGVLSVWGGQVTACGGSSQPIWGPILFGNGSLPPFVFSLGRTMSMSWSDNTGGKNQSYIPYAFSFPWTTTNNDPCNGGVNYTGPYPFTFNFNDYLTNGNLTRNMFCGFQFLNPNSTQGLKFETSSISLYSGDLLQGFSTSSIASNTPLFVAGSTDASASTTADAGDNLFIMLTTAIGQQDSTATGVTFTVSQASTPTPTPAPNDASGLVHNAALTFAVLIVSALALLL